MRNSVQGTSVAVHVLFIFFGRAKAFGIGTRYEVGVVGSSVNDQGHCGLQLVDRADVSQAPGVRFVWESQGLSIADRYCLRLHGQILRRSDRDAEQLEPLVLPQNGPLHQPRPHRLRRWRCESVSVRGEWTYEQD